MKQPLWMRATLRGLALGIFPLAGLLMLLDKEPAWLALLLLAPPLASLGWKDSTGLITVSIGGFALGALALMLSPSNSIWFSGFFTLLVMGAQVWICHRFLVREGLTLHTGRKIMEQLEVEIVNLRQEIETCEKALLQNQNRQRKYSLLNEATYRLGSSLQLKDLAEITLSQIINLLGDKPACFTLFVFAKDGAELLRLSHDTGAGLPFPADAPCEADDINRWAISRQTPLIIRSLERDFRFKGLDLHSVEGRCFLVSPLLMSGRVTGLVRVESRQEDLFDTEDQRLLESFLGMALLALENAKLFRETEELAITDGLTKLLLRRTLMERLEEELRRADRDHMPLAALLLDIDHFKLVNDRYGHPTGDQVLRVIAQILKASVRDVDLCGRYGGEEFVVVLPATSQAGAVKVAERIREAVAEHCFSLGGQEASRLTVSLGVASYPDDAQDLEALIADADLALYRSKQGGRNRVSAYSQLPEES
jgi:diguanylate cyclase (GGDEF)-like protein